ncbi:MAG: nicotinate mononucleotide-dependent phosphoribosyltransferase CobT [Cyanobacteria bacterium P01_D01_bin.105]
MIRVCAGNPYAWLARYRGQKPLIVCVLSFTETGLIPGISAAGKTPQARHYTALADGEFLLRRQQGYSHIRGDSQYALPPLKAGISPALISRAILTQQALPCCLLSTGLPGQLAVPHIALPTVMARSLTTGLAMTHHQVNQLWDSGLHWGYQLARTYADSYLVLGECVVGGTTTAQALLTALGYEVGGQVSSSHPSGNHPQKQALVRQGLSIWQQRPHLNSAFTAVAALGDPMQVVAAAIAITASKTTGVLLAGGAQMLAVYALVKAICNAIGEPVSPKIVVGTTRWVIEDKHADTVAIARAVGAPYLASELNFSQSPYAQLQAYERGFVKEGMAAGGCAIAASLHQGWGPSRIRQAVEIELRRWLY